MQDKIEGCTFDTLICALAGFRSLAEEKLPVKLAYNVMKISGQVEEELKNYSKLREEIEKRALDSGEEANVLGEIADLAHLEVDSEFGRLSMDDLDAAGVALSAVEMRGLMPFIE